MIKKILLLLFLLFLNINVYALEEVTFNKCIDGDTFKAVYKKEVITVRLLAVDTPEVKHPKKGEEFYGKEASEYTCNKLMQAKLIELEFDDNSTLKDHYDRYLAWVFIDDSLLQINLIKNGYAKTAYLYGDYKYTDELKTYEVNAKVNKIGIWSEETKDINNEYIYIIIILIILCILYFLGVKIPYKKIIKKLLKY